jgi:hypothetical protein
LVRRDQRDRIETTFRIGELRLETWQLYYCEAITGLAVIRPPLDLQTVLVEITGDVVVGVDAREIDPGAVARVAIGIGAIDIDADLRQREHVMAAIRVPAYECEAERTDGGNSEGLLGAGREIDAQCSGLDAHLDLEIRG